MIITHYHCENCGVEWDTELDELSKDRCPCCDRDVTALSFVEVTEQEEQCQG